MRCSQFAKYFAASTDSGTSDYLQAIVPPVKLGRGAQGVGLRRTRTLAQAACMCVRYRFAGYTRQRRERFGTRVCED